MKYNKGYSIPKLYLYLYLKVDDIIYKYVIVHSCDCEENSNIQRTMELPDAKCTMFEQETCNSLSRLVRYKTATC